ncbi:spermatogenesis-associated protein 17 isoform X1 [Acipenser ruthenus]|uniref:spermatogenesis-associated protein 17 isoform X1 n=1 Tax=Acipenser ruthenus TaxID=7906 RepID=UPI0027410A18|nr:spermatogenesis-associated protein 17 isoform X1 [Acipenser ruthenus]
MATMVKLQRKINGIKEESFNRNRVAEENRRKEHKAALLIQSWFRGCRVRAYLRHLQRKATTIQKIWRGYLGRMYFRRMVKTAYFIMKMNFYNEMAVRIQKRWRAYYVRKYVHNYYALKQYLEGLTMTNEIVRRELEEFAVIKSREREKTALESGERKKDYLARKMHYLVSTEQIAGVFNSPYKLFPDEMEFRLRGAKPLSPKASRSRKHGTEGIVETSAPGTPFTLPQIEHLPPIPKKKQQGPFRDPTEVLLQRYKPLEPTLRVATSIMSVEEAREELKRKEWGSRVNDELFHHFSNANKSRRHELMLHTSSKFGHVDYGTKHFREENPEKLKGKKDFKRVFTTVQVFDKFGKMYSSAGKAV